VNNKEGWVRCSEDGTSVAFSGVEAVIGIEVELEDASLPKPGVGWKSMKFIAGTGLGDGMDSTCGI